MAYFKILLVDDEAALRESLSRLLRVRGYPVNAVSCGEEALRALDEDDYDVVVLDLKMPGMNGITTLKEIKKRRSTVEIMILTGHGSIESALKTFDLGAHDYLTKPFDVNDLLARIENAGKEKELNDKKDMLDRMIGLRGCGRSKAHAYSGPVSAVDPKKGTG